MAIISLRMPIQRVLASLSAPAIATTSNSTPPGGAAAASTRWPPSTPLKASPTAAGPSRTKSLAVSALTDGTAKVWDTSLPPAPEPVSIFREHCDQVRAVAWNPAGDYFLSASSDAKIKLWIPGRYNSYYTFDGHSGWVNAVNSYYYSYYYTSSPLPPTTTPSASGTSATTGLPPASVSIALADSSPATGITTTATFAAFAFSPHRANMLRRQHRAFVGYPGVGLHREVRPPRRYRLRDRHERARRGPDREHWAGQAGQHLAGLPVTPTPPASSCPCEEKLRTDGTKGSRRRTARRQPKWDQLGYRNSCHNMQNLVVILGPPFNIIDIYITVSFSLKFTFFFLVEQ
ncbi:hypothetical protein B296_00017351 [Ensete ventricosum]|uniref:Peroxin-7 n=1 Tax=Ensete ventricosum TaxID=4639 RepID=A0A427B106_ENSVE|nr:hypothetical protein B296_00017351 [Ensete ventricosum]